MSDKAILLVTSTCSDAIIEVNQRNAQTALESKGINFEKIDGADPANKDVRNMLFGISELRGKYPQVFLKKADDSYQFIGLFEEFQSLLECDELPAEVLAQGNVPTFSKTFENAKA